MRPALPAPEYYGGSAPPAAFGWRRAYPSLSSLAGKTERSGRGRFPRSLLSGRQVRHPALPLRHRHGYPAALHRGLPSQASKTRTGVPPARPARQGTGCAPHPSPHPPGSSWFCMKRRNSTGSSRIPSRLAHRARPVRQYQADTTLFRAAPALPADPRIRLPSASPRCCDSRATEVSHPHPENRT